jgi:hypothetical protein
MMEEHNRAEAAERQREMERYKESIRYQQELERQLEEQEEKKQQAYEEFLKEKLMIDEIVRKIYEEDQRFVVPPRPRPHFIHRSRRRRQWPSS